MMQIYRFPLTFVRISGLLVVLIVTGCGGGGGSSGSDPSTVSDPSNVGTGVVAGAGAVTVSWFPPTTRLDGTALTDLSGYKVYYGTSSGIYTEVIDVTTPGIVDYVVSELSTGTYYFAVTAYDQSGLESPLSEEVSLTIN